MKILIIRHGEPDYEHDSLTERGWKEAALLADRLEKMDIAALYCSPLGRAKATAAPYLEHTGRTAENKRWLREFAQVMIRRPDFPEGLRISWDWLPQDWVQHPLFFQYDQWYTDPIFAEANAKKEYDEVANALDELLASHGYERNGLLYKPVRPNEDTIALFCHFGVECVLLSHLLNISPVPLWHGTCALSSSVTTLATEERREGIASFRMLAFGDTSHLYAGGMEPSFAARFRETYGHQGQRKDDYYHEPISAKEKKA